MAEAISDNFNFRRKHLWEYHNELAFAMRGTFHGFFFGLDGLKANAKLKSLRKSEKPRAIFFPWMCGEESFLFSLCILMIHIITLIFLLTEFSQYLAKSTKKKNWKLLDLRRDITSRAIHVKNFFLPFFLSPFSSGNQRKVFVFVSSTLPLLAGIDV